MDTLNAQLALVPIVEQIEGISVVRDDLIPGGTKRRFIDVYVSAPYAEFVYASPAYGGAQIALAHACALHGKQATIFTAKRRDLHPRTREAYQAGAKIMQVPTGYLSNVKAKARAYAESTGACLLPFGFDVPEAIYAIASAARYVYNQYGPFDECWCAAGSGVLSRGLQASGLATRYYAVAVGKDPDAGNATVIRHPRQFEQDSRILPPFPSCSNYDAKVWEYVKGRPGNILFWNVMR